LDGSEDFCDCQLFLSGVTRGTKDLAQLGVEIPSVEQTLDAHLDHEPD